MRNPIQLFQAKHILRHVIAICASLMVATTVAADRAHFVVTNDTINADLQPFTATINAIGNGHRLSPAGGGFEPKVFRTMLKTTQAAQNRIIAPARVISNWESWKTGALDGAEVEILRIENGAFRSVRRDRIAVGGHQSNGWATATPPNQIVAGDQTEFEFVWSRINRPDVPYYFTVRAVDREGQLSPTSNAVNITAPREFPRPKPEANNALLKASISEPGGKLAPPSELNAVLTARGTVKLRWAPVKGAAGYVVYRSDTPPSQHRGHYLELEGSGPAIEAGDLVMIRAKFYQPDRDKVLTNRVWSAEQPARPFRNKLLPWPDQMADGSWKLVQHAPNTPVSEPGETYLNLSLGQRQSLTLGNWNHSGLKQDWYTVLQPGRTYKFDVWMRSNTARDVAFEFSGFYGRGGTKIAPIRFSVSPEWQRYEGTFEVPVIHPSKQAGKTQLRLTGPGEFHIDNFRVFAADTSFLALPKEDVARLTASGMRTLRTHAFIKTGQTTYDLNEITNPGGVSNIDGGNSLPQTLTEIARVGMNPWLQIEPHFTREEWLGLAEYLAAPYDTSQSPASFEWAAKRAAQGHAPWVDQFDKIYFEIGNETWNRLFAPWVFPGMTDAGTGERHNRGAVYGLYQEYVLGILRESPHWPALADKLEPVIGGWSGFDYGFNAIAKSPNTAYLTHAAYNGGWDENAGPAKPDAKGFFAILTHPLQTSVQRADRHREAAAQIGAARGAPVRTGTYEAGPGYALNGLNKRKVSEEEATEQEFAMKSVAAATATLDAFLMRAARGQTLQNYFTYGSGQRWTSHARWNNGGQTFPAWDLLALFNQEALGDMLAVEALEVPAIDLAASERRDAVKDAPLVAAYATRTDDQLTLIIISRHVPGISIPANQTTSVSVDLPINAAGSLSVYSQTGTLQNQNVDREGSRILLENMAVPATLPRLDIPALPPGETLVYVFKDVS